MGLLIHLLILPFKRPIAGIIIGLVILGGVLAVDWDDAPTCGGATMSQGDTCHRITDSTNANDKSFDQVKSDQKPAPYIWGGIGGLLVVVGAISWPIRRRKKAAEAAQAAAHAQATAAP